MFYCGLKVCAVEGLKFWGIITRVTFWSNLGRQERLSLTVWDAQGKQEGPNQTCNQTCFSFSI